MEDSAETDGSYVLGTEQCTPPLTYGDAVDWLRARQLSSESRVHDIVLLGELGTTLEELEQAAAAVDFLMRFRGPPGAYTALSRSYPLVLAELVVAAGVHHYSQGNYWSWLYKRVGLPQQIYPAKWGQLFERVVMDYKLEPFKALGHERATRFVAKILAHGGIPTYCLSDLFEHLLVPAVRSGEHQELSPTELVDVWKSRPSAFLVVDKPVKRFLVYGGNVAHDFLGRCIEMVESGLYGAGLPAARDLGLPQRIIDEFGKWLGNEEAPKRARLASSRVRYSRPSLFYDPWLPDALNLSLPSQPLGEDDTSVSWSVTTDSWSRRIDASPRNHGRKATRQVELGIDSPFRAIEVGLDLDTDRIRTWRFTGISKARPYLMFDAATGQAIDSFHDLSPNEWWIIAPTEAEVSAVSRVGTRGLEVLEEFPSLAGGWSRYTGRHITLAGCSALTVKVAADSVTIPVRAASVETSRPYLMGGTPSTLPLVLDRTQHAYEMTPPRVVLPLPVKGDSRLSSSLWRVHIVSAPGAEPALDVRFGGDDPLLVACRSQDIAVIDLAARELLGSNPVGRFRITARGPLGLDAEFEIIVTPRIRVAGLREVVVPTETGSNRATFYVMTEGMVGSNGEASVAVVPSHAGYRVDVASPLDRVTLVILAEDQSGVNAAVTLTLPVQRLRWAIVGISEQAPSFTEHRQLLSIDEIEQAVSPSLVVDLPNLDGNLQVSARLEDSAGTVIHTFTERPIAKSRRFSLREVLDTARSRPDSHLRLCALVRHELDGLLPKRAVVAEIMRSLRISDLQVRDELTELGRTVHLTWTEQRPITNRAVRFWPLWRPWEQQPLEITVPDEARDYHSFAIDQSKLPPGSYRVEFVVVDPWVGGALVSPPGEQAGNRTDVEIGTESERQAYITSPVLHEPLSLLERFLATRDPRWLLRLEETLGAQDIRSALLAAMSILDAADANFLRADSSLQDIMATLRPILLGSSELLGALARLSGSTLEMDHKLRRLVVELGLLRENQLVLDFQSLAAMERQSLSHLWAPLQAVVGGNDQEWALHEQSNSQSRADELSGDGDERRDKARQVDAKPPGFDGQALQYGADRLRDMREILSLLPSDPLDPDFWFIANFDWLIRVKEDGELERKARTWAGDCFYAALADLHRLDRKFPDITEHVNVRVPTATGDPLARIPLLVGATALAERCVARGVLEVSELLREIPRGYHSPRESLEIAVELYTRDLCLMDALIAHYSEKGLRVAV